MSWFSGARTRMQLLFGRRAAESRIDEEVRFHLDMETNRLMREEGLTPNEARRRARATFGGVTQHTETLREGRGLAWLGGMSLDLKLGLRMLVKYPGLTLVGGVAMAFAIWMGAMTFEMVNMIMNPTLPLPGGDRIVQLRNWDVEKNTKEPRALYDFVVWRGALSRVTDIGAWSDQIVNLTGADGDVRPVGIAAISASAFRVASGTPLLGRTLGAADENPGAPPVIVLGYDIWRTRFASDSGVVGRRVQLGDSFATVVGVMREGFKFPVAHDLWRPLQVAGTSTPGEGPALSIFGRLTPGASLADAQAELTVLGQRTSAASPETHKHLRAQVTPYVGSPLEASTSDQMLMFLFNFFAIALLVLLCGNVALLLFARAATRESELIVRSALGASRGRIVAQLIAEALVLGAGAVIVGLGAAGIALNRWAPRFLEINLDTVPFWYQPHLSIMTVLYAIGLTLLGAVIAGALPALKVTRGLGTRLKEGTAGGGGLKFGGVWTAVIVAQVAVTVAFPVVVFYERTELNRIRTFDVGFRSEQYLSLKLDADIGSARSREDTSAQLARLGSRFETLRQRVAAEPGVTGVTFVDHLPRDEHPGAFVELDGSLGTSEPRYVISLAAIDPSYFDVLETPVLAGRAFHAGDVAAGSQVVIVDKGFVDQVMRGANPIGRRVRFARRSRSGEVVTPQPWMEIVGVAKELGMASSVTRERPSGVYQPLSIAREPSIKMVVHVAKGDPLSFARRVRALANEVDARVRLSDFQRLDKVADPMLWIIGMWLRITSVLTGIALLLSLAGIYAVLSFTVARRTREIGVRVALGASRRRIVTAIFRRPLIQVGAGVVAGGVLVGLITVVLSARPDSGSAGLAVAARAFTLGQAGQIAAFAIVMMGVCLLACIVPTRRALGIEPTEALREE
jgi:putative ABC transport system permease protein